MKKLFLGLVLLMSLLSISNANSFNDYIKQYPSILDKYPWMKQNGWVNYSNVCEFQNDISELDMDCSKKFSVTQNAFLPQWVGEITHIYYDRMKSGFSSSASKINITWRVSGSKYRCGQTINIYNPSDMKEFTHRSLAMKKCY